ncbi:AMP-forming long-chain acyl-CoA synthetase [Ignavibacterium album JCM 16511]|uniref:AMP-forming long-chain acyl-CoA synthetase n=1 Tax=Ignavibacterium album (strain DSM 19864 / JCM 16511 / NBRC 101810 / Mat9-16) TaxID=945713 RepID=I0AN20_IGNAJ|nr:GNAT family N-acetyltransferase [Ignavibacterium album]AFH50377.1 AMP-forming long-chain acyl-CoA synthetase [Ignavibacterium album JCM 16511]
MSNELKTLSEILLAGESAIEKEESKEIISELIEFFKAYTQSSIDDSDFHYLIEKLIGSGFDKELVSEIPVELFHSVGEKLLNSAHSTQPTNQSFNNSNNLSFIHSIIHSYLNLFRYSQFLKRVYEDKRWESLILQLIIKSNFTFDKLFYQRAKQYTQKSLFRIIEGNKTIDYSWESVNSKINEYRSSLQVLLSESIEETFIAFLLDNSLDMILLDLACLTSGIVNVMIPANSVPQHIEFILNQTKAKFIFVDDEIQLSKIKSVRNNLAYLQKAILLKGATADDFVITIDDFLRLKSDKKNTNFLPKENNSTDSLATIMYTSGTTGDPKGIMFSHLNIVYKRFCRAMAIPEIGDTDRFLSYLPLYHTFGRWLEMTGAIFWGAEYVFMENPSIETMINNFRLVKPSIFISIPKKWMQLYETIISKVDIESEDNERIKHVVDDLTGGNLRWGLSAAGYLPAEIFQFFQRYGIELMSGFGMTEATGGITMTPPHKYKPDSLGKALPGIEIKVAEDGELLIKGAYVMIGYFGEDPQKTFADGWLPTGDLMSMDEDGFIEIVDRKKEIYKNIKGETIAPQKIENLFRDFEAVKQVFLVGDHRPFNTVLIYPDYESETSPIKKLDDKQRQEYFASLIVSVNNFLAPFERIIDFRLTERPFSPEAGELTPKGTFKRRVIEKNFSGLINSMYEKNYIELRGENFRIRIPSWFLREVGILSRDIHLNENRITISKLNKHLPVELINLKEKTFRIGSFIYRFKEIQIDLQDLITNPIYWLGNKQLVEFTGNEIIQWQRKDTKDSGINFIKPVENELTDLTDIQKFSEAVGKGDFSLLNLHLAITLIQQKTDEATEENLLLFFSKLLKNKFAYQFSVVNEVLSNPELIFEFVVKKEIFKLLLQSSTKEKFRTVLINYSENHPAILNDEVIEFICSISKGFDNLTEILNALKYFYEKHCSGIQFSVLPISSFFKLLVAYGSRHPITYKSIRIALLEYELYPKSKRLRQLALKHRLELRKGLRKWLGENQKNAIDPETGEEYSWEDVLVFEEDVDTADKFIISEALIEQPVIREAVFLFSNGILIDLNSILPSGVWISFLNSSELRNVYRITVQTRFQGSFEFILHVNKTIFKEELEEEIKWIIMAGKQIRGERIAAQFGGLWEEYSMWTEEYIAGESVAKFLRREIKRSTESGSVRIKWLWRFFVWSAFAAYLKFRKITNDKIELGNPAPENIILPPHDYQTGSYITSFYKRENSLSYYQFILNFYNKFILKAEEEYPVLKNDLALSSILSAICEVEGTEKGLEIIQRLRRELSTKENFPNLNELLHETDLFIQNVKRFGFLPKQLYFAIKRFNRWNELNKNASLTAQAETIYDIYETYRLFDLEEDYPAVRTRFFIETVLKDSSEQFKNVLREIIKKQRLKKLTKDETINLISNLSFEFELTEKENFFLTRLSYPHLKPTDSATFLKVKGDSAFASGLVVQLTDSDGNPYLVRSPINPKEISRLHKLFLEANLIVTFRPEHNYLVAVSDRGFIIGGLFYYRTGEDTVQMEKIVVANRYRRKGISEGLMNELFNRMKAKNIKYVTTGFFRPEYFYRFGFKIERKYSGLVKEL